MATLRKEMLRKEKEPETDPPARSRLRREDRNALIIERATRYFADVGFDGNTRELAKSIGVSQSLLYHYYPKKQDLIEELFDRLYAHRWNPEWETLLNDAGCPLKDRVLRFYREYVEAVLTREWTRIFFFAALRGLAIDKRNFLLVRERILHTIARQLRLELGLGAADEPVTVVEERIVWSLHAAVFYIRIRECILELPSALSVDEAIELEVTIFLEGGRAVFEKHAAGILERAPAASKARPGMIGAAG